MGPLLRTPAQGTDTLVWLATTHRHPGRRPDRSGSTAGGARSIGIPMTRLTAADRRRLWQQVVGLTGLPDPDPPIPDDAPCTRRHTHDHAPRAHRDDPADRRDVRVRRRLRERPGHGIPASRRADATRPRAGRPRVALPPRRSDGRRVAPMEYRISVFEPSTRVVLVGSGSGVSAVDEIRFERIDWRHARRLHRRYPARWRDAARPAVPRSRVREPRPERRRGHAARRSMRVRSSAAALDGRAPA